MDSRAGHDTAGAPLVRPNDTLPEPFWFTIERGPGVTIRYAAHRVQTTAAGDLVLYRLTKYPQDLFDRIVVCFAAGEWVSFTQEPPIDADLALPKGWPEV